MSVQLEQFYICNCRGSHERSPHSPDLCVHDVVIVIKCVAGRARGNLDFNNSPIVTPGDSVRLFYATFSVLLALV